ncbi:phosphate ABC transporter permease PstA [soil metagenome]
MQPDTPQSPPFPEKDGRSPVAARPVPQNVAPIGEAQVWLTSMGLAVGIIMTLFLVGLIMVRGVSVFWPKPVVQLELAEGSDAAIKGSTTLAGEVVMERLAGPAEDRHAETQLFVGNKDAFGFAFRFLEDEDIVSTSFPEGIVSAERLEYGDGIFFPKELTTADGATIPASDPQFTTRFEELVEEGNDRRATIKRIEKKEIGAINRVITSLQIDKKVSGDEAEIAAIDEKIASLEAEYQVLADKAGALRERQSEDTLTYTLTTGDERSEPVSNIIAFYYPNQLSWLQRLGLFFSHMWAFLSQDPREANTEGGIFPAIFGTFVMTIIMSVMVTPFGVVAAIYLREYAKQGLLVRGVRISVNNLAGVPSIVFGVFGLGFFIYFVGGWVDQTFFSAKLPNPTYGTGGIFWASLTLALLTLPVVIVATEEALAAVPRGVREAALACGASKWQTIQRIVLPSATPGILTGVILAMARGAGEVAPLMLVGVVKLAPELPINGIFPFVHPEQKFMHLGFHIYDLGFQSPDSEAAKPMVFATTFLLILLVIVMNLAAVLLRNHLRKKYALASF